MNFGIQTPSLQGLRKTFASTSSHSDFNEDVRRLVDMGTRSDVPSEYKLMCANRGGDWKMNLCRLFEHPYLKIKLFKTSTNNKHEYI